MFKVNRETTKHQHDTIIAFIKEWFSDKKGPAVIGISGGKDSTVCAALLVEALGPDRVIGVTMPNGIQSDIEDSVRVCEILGIKRININIGSVYKALSTEIQKAFDCVSFNSLYATNTPARIRMVTLYGVAAKVGGFVCNTCNRSEDFVGYSTKWGDAVGDFTLVSGLLKTEVCALGDFMNLPENLVHKIPSDGMCGKSDEDNMGFTYEELDAFITDENWAEKNLEPHKVEKIRRMHNHPNTKAKLVNMAGPKF